MTIEVTSAKVEEISPLTDSIVKLVLSPDRYVDYQAGQYVNIVLDDQELSYSIANAPLGSHKYELHIRHNKENPANQKLFARIKEYGKVDIRLPLGEVSIDKIDEFRPILFIAGGTGFAPVQSMIEQLLAGGDTRPFELYWGARSQSDLYMDEKVKRWQAHVSRFTYYAFLAEDAKANIVSQLLAHHKDDLACWQMVISGPFEMAYSLRDSLVEKGVSPSVLHSDAFTFEKTS